MTSADIIPFIRYADARAAIDFLEKAFGFERVMVVDDESGGVGHAQLRLGNGLIMLSSVHKGDPHMKSARDLPATSIGIYCIVDDADAHHERAKAAGAKITMAPIDEDYGGRDYSVLDPEGNSWSFGTFRPE